MSIFSTHTRPDFETPMEETASALAQIVRQGKALYVGISSYSPERTGIMYKLLKDEGIRLFIHQPSYSMLNRFLEQGLLDVLGELNVGCIAFSPLAQGLLTNKYLKPGATEAARIHAEGSSFSKDLLSEANLSRVRSLDAIAQRSRPVARANGYRLEPSRYTGDHRPHRSPQSTAT